MEIKFQIQNPLTNEVKEKLVDSIIDGLAKVREKREVEVIGEGNYFGMLQHDCFLDALAQKMKFLSFKRGMYKGRLFYLSEFSATISIMSKEALKKIGKRKLEVPHYLRALVNFENKCFKGQEQQGSLFSNEMYTQEQLEKVFEDTYGNNKDMLKNYTHYIILYDAYKGNLYNVDLILLSPNFQFVQSWSLNEYIKPDIINLTENNINNEIEHNDKTDKLPRLKSNIDLKQKIKELNEKEAE